MEPPLLSARQPKCFRWDASLGEHTAIPAEIVNLNRPLVQA